MIVIAWTCTVSMLAISDKPARTIDPAAEKGARKPARTCHPREYTTFAKLKNSKLKGTNELIDECNFLGLGSDQRTLGGGWSIGARNRRRRVRSMANAVTPGPCNQTAVRAAIDKSESRTNTNQARVAGVSLGRPGRTDIQSANAFRAYEVLRSESKWDVGKLGRRLVGGLEIEAPSPGAPRPIFFTPCPRSFAVSFSPSFRCPIRGNEVYRATWRPD